MDPAIEQVLLGLVSNGLSSFIACGLSDGADPPADDAVREAVEAALQQLIDVPAISSALGGEALREFLRSAEVYASVRQIYASGGSGTTSIDGSRSAFYKLWRVRTGVDSPESQAAVDRLFSSLVSLCEHSLQHAIEQGRLSAAEARNARRHNQITDQLANINRALSVLDSQPSLDIQAIDDFAFRIRDQVASREGVITPPALDSARDFPVDDLYVPAQLVSNVNTSRSPMSYQEFSRGFYRSVILGNPGSGKSTLAKKLVTDLARELATSGEQKLVPFLVTLRDFGARKKEAPCSIADFISLLCNSRYQVSPPEKAIEFLLTMNRAVVVFDGLDELLDTSYRAEITGDVESFATLYPAVPILVTSRLVGYGQAPLSPSRFESYRLTEFTRDDVQTYATNWFAVSDTPGQVVEADEVSRFMADSAGVDDLRSNPLMLGLMCNLYKGSGYIPRNRPDVYEACAEMLFDRWDRLRRIGEPLSIESVLRPAMQHLAFWIYSNGELHSGVTERELIQEATQYLLGRRFDDYDDAKLEATRFIEFCRGRAWVFTDTGTQPSGERLYQFTHRTFLEFFAAGHLVRTNSSPSALLDVLLSHISDNEWDVVAQLAFQLLDHNVDGAATQLIEGLLPDDDGELDESAINRLDFAVRSLQFLVPTPTVTKQVASTALAFCMQWLARERPDEKGARKRLVALEETSGSPVDLALALAQVNPENAGPVINSLSEELPRMLGYAEVAPYAAELAFNLDHGVGWQANASTVPGEVVNAVTANSREKLRRVAKTQYGVAYDLVFHGVLGLAEFLAQHGLSAFLRERLYPIFPATGRISLGQATLDALFWSPGPGSLKRDTALAGLPALAQLLESSETPWYTAEHLFAGTLWVFNTRDRRDRKGGVSVEDFARNELFAIVACAAAYFEEAIQVRGGYREEGMEGLRELVNPAAAKMGTDLWSSIVGVLSARLSGDQAGAGANALDAFQLTPKHDEILRRWIAGDVSFVSVSLPDNEAEASTE